MKSSVTASDCGFTNTLVLDGQPRGTSTLDGVVAIESEPLAVEESCVSIPIHPLGVKPSGNQYTATSNARHRVGFFQILPDEILAIFLEYLDSRELRLLGSTCKFMSPQSKSGSFQWQGTWRSTHLNLKSEQVYRIRCDDVFSDVLYRPFLCTHTSLQPYTTNILFSNIIARFSDLSPEDFSEHWSDKPFILTSPVRSWPVYKSWDTVALLQEYSSTKFRAEAVDWTLSTYIQYMTNNTDESPLYLFDRSFVSKMSLSTMQSDSNHAYSIPACFGEDLFAVLGDQRPDDKWLIIGPARSGSTYHKDPNATSAWNAVLRGSKYWIMFPSGPSSPPPPGVYVSADQSEVTSPLSIAEWLLGFHAEARKTPGCIEGVCREGEVLHVPSGWWHLVVNLEESIAITQNFVPRAHLSGVLGFLRDKREQVSGFRKEVLDPYEAFMKGMRREHPELLEQGFAELQKETEGRKRKWDVAVGRGEAEASGFSFGFGDESDEEVP
ncbi:F-box [Hyphodiscus hymeniophilus]|uniref:F-box n=1 Tax=Hyphodiscus hymeniophilus TaxID=353542 RepID=A0A9P7AZH3_9HELO|nr:F-box [Hyphodiscus hymeniophilus]